MAFLKKLFRRKSGGTITGNIFRRIADHFTADIYSSIFPIPS